jgi:hypothetical protein
MRTPRPDDRALSHITYVVTGKLYGIHGRLARNVTFVRVDVPARDYVYHDRLVATIALAEVARQVGQCGPGDAGRPRRHAPFYDRALELLDQEHGETVFLEDFAPY